MTIINYCPDCGNKINDNGKFCPNCGSRLTINSSSHSKVNEIKVQSKREKILKKGNNSSSKKGLYVGLVVALFVGALIFYINAEPSKEASIIENQPKVSDNVTYPSVRYDHNYSIAYAKDGKIILPLDVVKEKKFVKFDYITQNTTIPLLAYLTEDGKVVTAISICEPCDSKSFHIKGSDLVCNSCGTTWDLNNLDAISGSCGKYPPDPIPSKIIGNEIQIDEYLVTGWTRRV
ncbi:MAG: Fe-S-containing protein [Ignavibacteria bacterium]|nr:Fe-S-containing protein [Ignavibacteria bacterium]